MMLEKLPEQKGKIEIDWMVHLASATLTHAPLLRTLNLSMSQC